MKDMYSFRKVLITGVAGFIGSFLCSRLLEECKGISIVGIDNMNDYYDIDIKMNRLELISRMTGFDVTTVDPNGFTANNFKFIRMDISDVASVEALFQHEQFDVVINLAAQAGVRYSIDNPESYITSNIVGFFNILESCRRYPVDHLIYASSSSVYGANTKFPYSVDDKTDSPVSLYAATKKSDELMAYSYSKLYDIPATGLRFFTVYGPMGRPDMAYFKFTNQMVKGESIQIFNNGDLLRDFTYIDDIVTGIMLVLKTPPVLLPDGTKHKVYNIGNTAPVPLMTFIETLETLLLEEKVIDTLPKHEFLPMQPGDVYQTFADMQDFQERFNFNPKTRLKDGLRKFVKWYKNYFGL